MKWILIVTALFVGAIVSDEVIAATTCDALGSRQKASEIDSKLTGQLVCAQKMGAVSGNDRWAEEHRATKDLVEQGKGTTSKVHPPHKVGTWASVKGASPSGSDDFIRHSYTGGSSFDWSVFQSKTSATSFTFCTTNETTVIATATITAPNPSSTNACGFPVP